MKEPLTFDQLLKATECINKIIDAPPPSGTKLAMSLETLKELDPLVYEEWKKQNPDDDIVIMET